MANLGAVTGRDGLLAFVARNSTDPTDYRDLPVDRVVELGVPLRA